MGKAVLKIPVQSYFYRDDKKQNPNWKGNIGEKVKVIADHGEVLIVELRTGVRIPVKREYAERIEISDKEPDKHR